MPEEPEIRQGYKNVGDYNTTERVGQKSVFGPRRDRNYWEKSIGERLMNMLTDRLRLTSPPSYTDGYGTQRGTEVPLRESAAGQEAERMVNSLGKLGLGTSFVVNPVGTTIGLATAYGANRGANFGMNLIDKYYLNPKGLQLGTSPRTIVSTAATMGGFGFGHYAGAKVPVTFNKRSIDFGNNKPVVDALRDSDYVPRRFELWLDQLDHNLWKSMWRIKGMNTKATVGKLLGNGSEANVFVNEANPNTVIKGQHYGLVLPDRYQGNLGVQNPNIAQMMAEDIANIKNRGAYTADITPTNPMQINNLYVPTFLQQRMTPVKDMPSFTPKQTRALTRLMMNAKPYADAHLGNVAMDPNGTFWFIDAPLKSKIEHGFETGSPWFPREDFKPVTFSPNSSSFNPFSVSAMQNFLQAVRNKSKNQVFNSITKPLDYDIDQNFGGSNKNFISIDINPILQQFKNLKPEDIVSDLPPD